MKGPPFYYSFLVLILALYPPFAHSDSDGLTCSNKGYIAYELDSRNEPGDHILYIVAFGVDSEIGPVNKITIPKYSVRGMRCKAAEIDLLMNKHIYKVKLPENGKDIQIETVPFVDSKKGADSYFDSDKFINKALNYKDRFGRYELRTDNSGFKYWIEINAPFVDECTRDISTKLVERDVEGKIVNSKLLFFGQYFTECGEGPSMMRRERLSSIKPRTPPYAGKEEIVLIGKILSKDVKFVDFGENYGGIYTGKIQIKVEGIYLGKGDSLKTRLVHSDGATVATIQYKSTAKKSWLNYEETMAFSLYPLEHTLEFGLRDVSLP